MVLEYFQFKKGTKAKEEGETKHEEIKSPVLSDKDEEFLRRIASQEDENPPPLPARPTVILEDGNIIEPHDDVQAVAESIPLPRSPLEEPGQAEPTAARSKRSFFTYLPSVPLPTFSSDKDKARIQTANDLASAAKEVKASTTGQPLEIDDATTAKEKEDLSKLLDRLHLSAINNRAFSISEESQKLMDDFTQVLKDIINGVPTAYDDLETLLTRNNKQIKKMYKDLPPWLQTLVKALPAKIGASLGPDLVAAGSGVVAEEAAPAGKGTEAKGKEGKKKRSRIPSVKRLVSEQGAVAAMLRSILNFLKLRFPAFVTGTNLLMSLAVFLLLFVLWYCHKRGREVRLGKERLTAEADSVESDSGLERSVSDMDESSIVEDDVKSGIAPTEVDPPVIEETSARRSTRLEAALSQKDPAQVSLPSD